MKSISTEEPNINLKWKVKDSKLGKNLPGVLMVLIVAYIAHLIGQNIPLLGSTVVAIALGVLLRNFLIIPSSLEAGIQYSLKKILKYAIVLLGLSLNLMYVLSIGLKSIFMILLVVTLGIGLTILIGKMLRVSEELSTLIGVGTAICGATAIATVSPIMKAKESVTAYAITTIFIFNVIAVIVYPLIGMWLGMTDEEFGIWAGLAIHDTSSVVAAGYVYSDAAGGTATIVKLTRTLFLIPIAVILGAYITVKMKKEQQLTNNKVDKVSIVKIFPMFLLGFLAFSLIRTTGIVNDSVVSQVTEISKFMILMAMVSVGLGANFKKIKEVGLKPVYVGLFASIIIAGISLALVYIVV